MAKSKGNTNPVTVRVTATLAVKFKQLRMKPYSEPPIPGKLHRDYEVTPEEAERLVTAILAEMEKPETPHIKRAMSVFVKNARHSLKPEYDGNAVVSWDKCAWKPIKMRGSDSGDLVT